MLKRAKEAPGVLEVAMGEDMVVHLRHLLPHCAHGKRGSIIKMVHLILGRRHSFGELDSRPETFLWQCSGTFDPENRAQFVPETERRVWKPPWLQRRRLLVNSFPWFTTQTHYIWYVYSLVFGYLYGIVHVSACGSLVFLQFKPTESEFSSLSCVQSFRKVQSSKYWFIWCLLGFYFHYLACSLAMAPRQRGIPRRGSNYGGRGGNRGGGVPNPPCIIPLASKSPSSPSSEHSGPSLHNSLHSCRFKFKSKLHKPTISALLTVIFSEEEEDSSSSEEYIKDSSLSLSPSSSHENEARDILNAPDPLQTKEMRGDSPLQSLSANDEIIPCAPASSSANMAHLMSIPEQAEKENEEIMGVEGVSTNERDIDADEDMHPQA